MAEITSNGESSNKSSTTTIIKLSFLTDELNNLVPVRGDIRFKPISVHTIPIYIIPYSLHLKFAPSFLLLLFLLIIDKGTLINST